MDFVNFMFLAMAGMIIFLSWVLISSWVQGRKSRRDVGGMSEPAPPRKRTISGRVATEDAAVELSARMVEWQRRHPSARRLTS